MRESIGMLIFRYVLAFGLFFFMGMLYWSSLLLEEDSKEIFSQISELRKEVGGLRTDLSRLTISSLQQLQQVDNKPLSEQKELASRPHIDPSFPNLLQQDPYYLNILPKLLPKDFKPIGARHAAVLGRPDTLHPFMNLYPYTTFISQCQLQLATLQVGRYEVFSPSLAIKIEERPVKDFSETNQSVEYWIHLREGVMWQPLNPSHFPEDVKLAPMFLQKHPVTAYDVKFYIDATLNPFVQEGGAVAARNYIGDIEDVRVLDDLTLVVRWKSQVVQGEDNKPIAKVKYAAKSLTAGFSVLPSFVYQYFPDGKKIIEDDSDPNTYRTNSVWAQQFSRHWARQIVVSCGPWIFDGMTDKQIRLIRNPDHFNPFEVLVDSTEIEFKDSPDALWQDFKVNATDTYVLGSGKELDLQKFLSSPDYKQQEGQENQGLAIKKMTYVDRSFFYLGWNEATPYFKSKKARQAMTLAIDRNRMIKQNLNGLAIPLTGPMAIDSSAYDSTIVPWSFDPEEAKHLLEEDGWFDSDGDGIRDKIIDGKKVNFSFYLTYYVKNSVTKVNCEFIADSLKEIGVDCRLKGLDVADIMQSIDNKDFDVIFFGWTQGTPPEDPRQLWHSSGAKEKGSSNIIGYTNPEVDKLIEVLTYEADQKKRVELYHQFHRIIHEEQPYTFLYIPKNTLLYRDYVKNVFIPSERKDLIPGSEVSQPNISVTWLSPPN